MSPCVVQMSLGRVGTAHLFPVSPDATWWALPTLLAEMFFVELGNFTAAPILAINTGTDVTVKSGIRPIDHAGHVAVFDGVPMDIYTPHAG
jgi:hypothetical protein